MSRRKFLSLAAALAVLSVGYGARPANAFRMIQNNTVGRVTAGAAVTCNDAGGFAHWNAQNINWFHNTAAQGAGKAAALTAAMASWTAVTGAIHTPRYIGTTTAGWATDGQNTILWANGNGCTGSCLALTALVLNAGQVIVESDITFNNTFTWSTNGTNQDTQSVATHELGHTLGIHHTELTAAPLPTMFATYSGGTDPRTLEADDRAALQCSQAHYPPAGAFTASLSCSGNFKGSTQVSCCVVSSGGCGDPISYTGWTYGGTATAGWSSGGNCAYAYYSPPGCGNGSGSSVNFFSVNVADSCGTSVLASAGSLPCF